MNVNWIKLSTMIASIFAMAASGLTYAVELEEILVTAQKREQSLQEVGVSVTAFTGKQIDELGFISSIDVIAQTPNLSFGTPTGEGNNASLTLRGVGLADFNDNNEGPVAVYVDEVYLSALSGVTFQLLDLQRIEVLRGPQGTLYGRNTTGGLVHFITAKPTTETEGYFDILLAQNSQIKFEGVISGSLGETVQARLSYAHNQYDGYVENRNPGFEDPNDANNNTVRLQMAWQPAESVAVLFNVHGSKNDANMGAWQHETTYSPDGGITSLALPADVDYYGTCPGCDAFGYRDNDGDPWAGEYDRDGDLVIKNSGGSVNLQWAGEGLIFTSITAFESFDRYYEEDTDVSPYKIIHNTYDSDIDQFTQEFRLNGESDRLNWVAGLFYYDQKVDGGFEIDASGIGYIIGDANYQQKTKSWAAYGQIEYALTDSWSLIGGLRYTDEKRELDYLSVENGGLFPPDDNTMFDYDEEISHSNVTGKVGLDWQTTEDTLLYGTVSLGNKSAGFNTGLLDETGIFGMTDRSAVPYDPEKLTAYEIGMKTDLFDGSSRLNTALFYYDYNDYQAFAFIDLNQVIFNTDATIKGFELEFVTSPVEGLDLSLGVGYLDTKAKDIPLNDGSGVTRDREMPLAPPWTVNGIGRYEWGVGSGSIAAQLDFSYQAETYFDIQNHPISQQDGYSVWNARLTYIAQDGKWELAAFVNNLFDEEYRIYSFDVTNLFGFNQVAYGRPQWFGVSFRYNLN